MKIPPLNIEDETEVFFRNLMAFEEYNGGTKPNYVIDYAKVIDCLINFLKDAEKLRHYGIIDNWLGDDKVVSTLFNKLGNQISINSATFCYSKVFNKVNKHCERRRHTWMAKLKHNYFNSPWSTISVVGAEDKEAAIQ
ncbi:unnamed protein product [Ilex paraguariensis]|uniref:Uncharacterized protein n=1 Tax=Ilex paraguariensis TaxID=185542 RepID=A0ABC8SBB7_9AQUA